MEMKQILNILETFGISDNNLNETTIGSVFGDKYRLRFERLVGWDEYLTTDRKSNVNYFVRHYPHSPDDKKMAYDITTCKTVDLLDQHGHVIKKIKQLGKMLPDDWD